MEFFREKNHLLMRLPDKKEGKKDKKLKVDIQSTDHRGRKKVKVGDDSKRQMLSADVSLKR